MLSFVFIAVLALYAVHSSRQNHDSLCALKQNLETQISQSEDFIATHPHGIPGVPVAVLQAQIVNQVSADNALSGLDCAILPPVSKSPNGRK